MKRLVVAALIASTQMAAVGAQTHERQLTFDVVAIHRTPPEEANTPQTAKPLANRNGYMTQNFTVKAMIGVMYRLPLSRIEGGPNWIDEDRYDIEARADKPYTIDELHTMFKNLLADRFGLKYHIETRQDYVYNLVVDKGGVKMKPVEPSPQIQIPVNFRGPGDCVGTSVPMSYFAFFLSWQILGNDHPVIDKTGLTQTYDFTLTYIPEFPGVPTDQLAPELQNRPTLNDALQEQLGLRLESSKGPVDSFIVDAATRPSAN